MNISSKSIVSMLATLTSQGHEIISCDFRTGEVTLRMTAQDARTDLVVAEYLSAGKIPAIKLDRQLYTKNGIVPGLLDSKNRVEALIASRFLVYEAVPAYTPPVAQPPAVHPAPMHNLSGTFQQDGLEPVDEPDSRFEDREDCDSWYDDEW